MPQDVVLLPGVTGGFGPTLARAFAARGASLCLAAHKEKELLELQTELGLPKDRVLTVVVDVTDPASVERLVQEATARFGRIDVLVNIVGGYRGGKELVATGDDDFAAMMSLNALSVVHTARAVVPGMLARGHGRVISIASKLALQAVAGHAAYAAAKAAVLRITEALAAEVHGKGVTANAVVPSTIDTEANRKAMPASDRRDWVLPEDLASVIVFLASPEAAAVNGAAIPVYGRG